ncbi:dihydroorotase [Tepiditoga spiralis]
MKDGKIIKISDHISTKNEKVIDASNKLIIPGIIDMHVHLRSPGYEYKETLETGLKAAVHGGITTIGMMPNTNPTIDTLELIKNLNEQIKKINLSNVLFIPALTKNRDGKELVNISEIQNYAVGFSDDGSPINNTNLMLKALKILKKPIIDHCEVTGLNGSMREGVYSNLYKIKGIPDISETIMAFRDIEVSRNTGAHIHIAHISTKRTVKIIRDAKKQGINITCEATHNHFLFKDIDVKNANYKVNPPLPTQEDLEELINGIKDGTIDILITDHAPHSKEEKERNIENSPFGISGLETFLSGILMISKKHSIPLKKLINMVTHNPAKIFNLKNVGDIKEGYNADLTIFDTNKNWKVTEETLYSKGKNTPFLNMNIPGVVEKTIINGVIKYEEG